MSGRNGRVLAGAWISASPSHLSTGLTGPDRSVPLYGLHGPLITTFLGQLKLKMDYYPDKPSFTSVSRFARALWALGSEADVTVLRALRPPGRAKPGPAWAFPSLLRRYCSAIRNNIDVLDKLRPKFSDLKLLHRKYGGRCLSTFSRALEHRSGLQRGRHIRGSFGVSRLKNPSVFAFS